MEQFPIDDSHLRLFAVGSSEINVGDLSVSRRNSDRHSHELPDEANKIEPMNPIEILKQMIKQNDRSIKEKMKLKRKLRALRT